MRFQIRQQPVDRLIHLLRSAGMQPDQLAVRIPTDFVAGAILMRDLDKSYVALRQASRHQALPAKIAGFRTIEAVQFFRGFRFPGNIEGFGRLVCIRKASSKAWMRASNSGS